MLALYKQFSFRQGYFESRPYFSHAVHYRLRLSEVTCLILLKFSGVHISRLTFYPLTNPVALIMLFITLCPSCARPL